MPEDGSNHISRQANNGQRYRALFENAHAVMLLIDPADGAIVDANAAATAYYGWPREQLLSMHIHDINTLTTKQLNLEIAHVAAGEAEYYNFRHRCANGEVRDVEVFAGPVVIDEQALIYSIVHDVTEKKSLERNLSFLSQRAYYMLELPALAETLDEKTFMQRGLEMVEDLTGSQISFLHLVKDESVIEIVAWSSRTLDSYCAMTEESHLPIDQAGVWADSLRQRQPVVINDYAATGQGLPEGHSPLTRMVSLPVVEHGTVVMLAGIGNKPEPYSIRDVETLQLLANDIWRIVRKRRSERELAANLAQQRELNQKLEEAQNQLLQSEKMASIGQLAAGVAHELNNPIGFVSSNLGSLDSYLRDVFSILDAYAGAEADLPDTPALARVRALKQEKDLGFLRTDTFQLMSESKDGLARVAKIVRDLKDFSRAGEATLQWADLHQGIESTLNIVWNELKYKCTVKKEFGELPPVWCVPSQLNQVFMNLLVNAAHAIPEKGEIVIRTGQRDDQVFVAIADTGTGIPPENINRIFEPFFTTKPVGKGTGLGLSLSYSIVQKHAGRIEVTSAVGKGTTFTVWLPIQPPANTTNPTVPPAPTLH